MLLTRSDPQLNQWLVPIVFNEEQYAVSSLSGLWELVAKYLEDNSPDFHGLFDEMDSNYSRFENEESLYEQFVFVLLISLPFFQRSCFTFPQLLVGRLWFSRRRRVSATTSPLQNE